MANNIGQIPESARRQLYFYTVGFYVMLPLLLYVSILKLSTHNGYVSTQI